jgi:hypothetical protein
MANEGVPLGGQFPARSEMGPLSPFVKDVRSIGANRGYDKYNQLSANYQEAPYYDPQTDPYVLNQNEQVSEPTASVILTDVPTSSTDYSRPRTVAAGYDPQSKTMTVVFRDGTFYNYYQVNPGEWEAFSASFSKGKPWLNRGFRNGLQKMDGLFIGKPRGVASPEDIPPAIQEQLYRVSRAQQLYRQPKPQRGNPEMVARRRTKANPQAGNPADKKRKR